MAITYLQAVNGVLRRLRQTEVNQVPQSSYSKLIGCMVNQVKREVEDAWRWSPLLQINDYSLTDTADGLLTLAGLGNRAQIASVFHTSVNLDIRPMTQGEWIRRIELGGEATGQPLEYRLKGFSTTGTGAGSADPILQFFPVPDQTYTIRVYAYVGEEDLSSDDDLILVPEYPVILGAYARAVSERGEDNGTMGREAEQAYRSALNDAIAQDTWNHSKGEDSRWVVV